KLGKSAGKDLVAEKSTYPALLGLKGAQKEAKRLTDLSMKAIKPLGSKAEPLLAIADFMLNRES
ncbi:MAG: polyprenyl synthetase family protein, partial [Verrucomicrobiota bacterium]